ncbi:MAG: class I SAM-dependent methyltransferase, partial [Bacteroidetes bacterium]
MNWRQYWHERATEADPYRQVARTGGRVPIDAALMTRMNARLVELLDLQPEDRLLDLCCGNGMVTRALAAHCAETVGVDLAPGQIARAQAGPAQPGLRFQVGDVTRLGELGLAPFDKINLHFSFQYLERPAQGRAALRGMRDLLRPGGCILIGEVPDLARLAAFYPRRLDRWRYRLWLR